MHYWCILGFQGGQYRVQRFLVPVKIHKSVLQPSKLLIRSHNEEQFIHTTGTLCYRSKSQEAKEIENHPSNRYMSMLSLPVRQLLFLGHLVPGKNWKKERLHISATQCTSRHIAALEGKKRKKQLHLLTNSQLFSWSSSQLMFDTMSSGACENLRNVKQK